MTGRGARRVVVLGMAGTLVAALLVVFVGLGAGTIWPGAGTILPDEPVPERLRDHVGDARATVRRAWPGIGLRPLRLAAARCRDDGGVVLVFEKTGPLARRYAYVLTGFWPPAAWDGGGWFPDLQSVQHEPVIVAFLGSREVDCTA